MTGSVAHLAYSPDLVTVTATPEGHQASLLDTTLAMRPLEPDAPVAPGASATKSLHRGGHPLQPEDDYSLQPGAPLLDLGFDGVVRSGSPQNEEEHAVITVDQPFWLRSTAATTLWSGPARDAQAFTDIPADSLMRVQGPSVDGRTPVYYVGDGLLRQPGNAWVDTTAVREVEAPVPGEVAEVDTFAERTLQGWVQVHQKTTLWSGPDDKAVVLTDLPQWTYLKVAGAQRDGRLLVEFEGDYQTRQPGVGWVDQSAVGPSGEPGSWVQSQRPTALWSGMDDKAQRFTDLPAWTKLRVIESGPLHPKGLLVEFFGDGGARLPGLAWVPRGDVGPIPPPTPLPSRSKSAAAVTANAPVVPLKLEPRTFRSEADFIETIGAAASKAQRATGVPASVAVAQAILESDWGRSRLTRQANNLFGIKSFGLAGPAGTVSLPTWEHLDGADIIVQAAFKAYHTLEESIEDHNRFFLRNRRYAGALAVATDSRAFARAIQEAGYATDPAYADKLIRLMDRYNLYRFDAG